MYIVKAIAEDLGLSVPYVSALVSRVSSLYYSFFINERLICAPKAELRLVQTWVADFIRIEDGALPPYVTAYEDGSSIVKNAAEHAHNSHMLNLDIKGFFCSCSTHKVLEVFKALHVTERKGFLQGRLTDDDAAFLTKLSCLNGSLPMGAPSSPFIANRIMVPIDDRLKSAMPEGYTYTRYSDDICISSSQRIEIDSLVPEIERILGETGFKLNRKKIRFGGKGDKRKVTGIYITSDGRLSIGKERKRQIQSDLYRVLMRPCQRLDAYKVWGELNFCKQVSPEYFNSLVAKYSSYGMAVECGGVIPALRSMIS